MATHFTCGMSFWLHRQSEWKTGQTKLYWLEIQTTWPSEGEKNLYIRHPWMFFVCAYVLRVSGEPPGRHQPTTISVDHISGTRSDWTFACDGSYVVATFTPCTKLFPGTSILRFSVNARPTVAVWVADWLPLLLYNKCFLQMTLHTLDVGVLVAVVIIILGLFYTVHSNLNQEAKVKSLWCRLIHGVFSKVVYWVETSLVIRPGVVVVIILVHHILPVDWTMNMVYLFLVVCRRRCRCPGPHWQCCVLRAPLLWRTEKTRGLGDRH